MYSDMTVISFGILLLVYVNHVGGSISAAKSRWSPEFLSQARDLSCEPGDVRDNVTFLHGTRSGNFTKLGRVAELEVCMLLCCELDRCQAAFLAGRNCYAVTCFSPNHCVTAPALNNKWKPMVAFVKRFKNVVHVKPALNESSHDNDPKSVSGGKDSSKTKQSKNPLVSKNDGNAKNKATSSKTSSKKKAHLEKFFTEEEHAKPSKKEKEAIIKTDSADAPADSLELEELQKQVTSQRKVAHAQRHSAKYSLVSAAVATCLMAFLLSGCAVVAAKIRKRKDTSEYSEVPEVQE